MSGKEGRDPEEAPSLPHSPFRASISFPFLPRLSWHKTRLSTTFVNHVKPVMGRPRLTHPSFAPSRPGHPATFAPESRGNHHPVSHVTVYTGPQPPGKGLAEQCDLVDGSSIGPNISHSRETRWSWKHGNRESAAFTMRMIGHIRLHHLDMHRAFPRHMGSHEAHIYRWIRLSSSF